MADYQIIIKAILDKADLQTQINQVQQTINTATQGKGITLIDSKSNNAAIQAIRQEVESFVDFGKVNQIKLVGDSNDAAIVNYTNKLGDTVIKAREFNEETKKWEYNTVSVTDNIAKTRSELEKMVESEKKLNAQALENEGKVRLNIEKKLNQEAEKNDKLFRKSLNDRIALDQELAKQEEKIRNDNEKAINAEAARNDKQFRQNLNNEIALNTQALENEAKMRMNIENRLSAEAAKNDAKFRQNINDQIGLVQQQANYENKMFDDRSKYINKWSNDLERIKINNQEAFADPKIQQAFDDLNKKVQNFSGNLNEKTGITKDMNNFKTAVARAMAEAGNGIANFVSEMKIAIQRTIEWTVAVGGLYAVIHSLQDGIQYIKDLNKEMTNVAAVTGASKDTIASLAMQYNELASEVGATTLEVTRGSLEWVRQGKTAEETAQLLEISMKMSKLAALDSASATQYMTAIMNSYGLSVQQMSGVLDELVALDNKYATSVGQWPKHTAMYGLHKL